MPFELPNSIFQALINSILRDFINLFVFVYLDIFIFIRHTQTISNLCLSGAVTIPKKATTV